MMTWAPFPLRGCHSLGPCVCNRVDATSCTVRHVGSIGHVGVKAHALRDSLGLPTETSKVVRSSRQMQLTQFVLHSKISLHSIHILRGHATILE